jgi:Domain of unknown function (DUF4411)
VFVFDSSAYISGWRHHLPRDTFPGPWALIEEALGDGRIVSPRAVYVELQQKDDDVYAWAHEWIDSFVEPSEDVQRDSGVIYGSFPQNSLRNAADPWVIAEARAREWTVVTYEGQTFSGVPTTRWHRSMPGICGHYSVPCATLPEALGRLGGRFE